MKKLYLTLVALFMPIVAWAQSEVAESNEELISLVGDLVAGVNGGGSLVAVSAGLALLISVLRNSSKIPLLKWASPLITKIPKKWFPVVVVAIAVSLQIVNSLVSGIPMQQALLAGLQMALMSAGLHEVVKRPLQALGIFKEKAKA